MQKKAVLDKGGEPKVLENVVVLINSEKQVGKKTTRMKAKKAFQNINLQKIWYLYLQKKFTINECRTRMMR